MKETEKLVLDAAYLMGMAIRVDETKNTAESKVAMFDACDRLLDAIRGLVPSRPNASGR